jgi:GAF domain-containing protein
LLPSSTTTQNLIAFSIVSFEVYAIGDGTKEVQILGYPIIILFATLLLGPRGAWVFTFLSSLSYTAILFIHKYQIFRPYEFADELLPLDAVVATVILVLVAVVQVSIVNRLTQSLNQLRANETELRSTIQMLEDVQDSLETTVRERTAQIAVSAEVGRAASSFLDPDKIIDSTVNLITERFGYYYAGLFLVDQSGIWANLRSATGEAGSALMDRKHRLQIGGRSMVGSAIASRRPRIALDAGTESVRFDNPFLPNTRSEIALPLIVGNQVLGALDVQSVEGNAFDSEDIEVLQNMANQVAVAIDNARLYQESQTRLDELNRFYRHEFLAQSRSLVFREGQLLEGVTSPIPNVNKVVAEKSIQVEQKENHTIVTVPFVSGGNVIGVMNLKSKNRRWTADEINLIELTSNQIAITLENALLVRESQDRAQQERFLNEGTARIRETFDIEAILQTAATDIQRTLNLMEVDLQLGLDRSSETENGQ